MRKGLLVGAAFVARPDPMGTPRRQRNEVRPFFPGVFATARKSTKLTLDPFHRR